MSGDEDDVTTAFREFSRRMSIATRAHDNARHTSMSVDRTERALSMK